MNAHVQTYKQLTAPPSIALAMMAYRLAWSRKAFGATPSHYRPCSRWDAHVNCLSVPTEHYLILDRITRGERP